MPVPIKRYQRCGHKDARDGLGRRGNRRARPVTSRYYGAVSGRVSGSVCILISRPRRHGWSRVGHGEHSAALAVWLLRIQHGPYPLIPGESPPTKVSNLQPYPRLLRLEPRRVLLAVDLNLGLASAPLVFGNVGKNRGDMAAAAAPCLLVCGSVSGLPDRNTQSRRKHTADWASRWQAHFGLFGVFWGGGKVEFGG